MDTIEESDRGDVSPSGRSRMPAWTHLFVWAVLLVLFIVFFNAVSTVLLGVLAAAIVACTLNPLVRFIPGPRGVAAALLGLALIAVVVGLVLALSWPLAGPIKSEVAEWPQTQQRVNEFMSNWSYRLGLVEPLTVDELLGNIGRFFAGEGGQQVFSRSADVSVGILIWLAFIFIGSIFFLADPDEKLLRPALLLAPSHQRPRLRLMLEQLGTKLRRWVIGTFISMCIVFTASLIGYLFIGLEFAVPLALLAGLCEIVPTVGPASACVIASVFAAATQGGSAVLGVISVYAIIQSIEAYVILPMIMRGAVKIHPAVTLFSVVFWGKVFGVPGLMLAIPINVTLWSILDHFLIRRRDEAAQNQSREPVTV